MKPSKLKKALEKSWSRETSYWSDDWSEENPSYGQCAVTALVIQDYFGGELLRGDVDGYGSHYWNMLSDGSEVDFTKQQFPKSAKITEGKRKNRSQLLRHESLKKRYETLRERVTECLELD